MEASPQNPKTPFYYNCVYFDYHNQLLLPSIICMLLHKL
jgi:hypothetical protein